MDNEIMGNLMVLSMVIIYIAGNFLGIVCSTLVVERIAEYFNDLDNYRENLFYKITQYIIKSYYQMRIDAKQFSWTIYLIVVPLINIPVFIYIIYLFTTRYKINKRFNK